YDFFFSSERRHTRSYGDWSSDVCSSDLEGYAGGAGEGHGRAQGHAAGVALRAPPGRAVAGRLAAAVAGREQEGLGLALLPGQLQIGRASCRERVWSAVGDACLESGQKVT